MGMKRHMLLRKKYEIIKLENEVIISEIVFVNGPWTNRPYEGFLKKIKIPHIYIDTSSNYSSRGVLEGQLTPTI
jgi:hypothetical protein